jgi:hypothetical protein
MWTAAGSVEPQASRLKSSHAKIRNLDIVVSIKQDVFGFEISMTDIESVAVRQAGNNLTEETNCLLFG